jgi:hypothetical protein
VLQLLTTPASVTYPWLFFKEIASMTDWQIIESDNFPEPPPEAEIEPGRQRWRWGLWALGLLLFLGLAGFWTLRERRTENQTALTEDLSAVIFDEETRRSLGQPPDEALIDPTAPRDWQAAYRRTFTAGTASPGEVAQMTELAYFDGRCAVVTVAGPTPDRRRGYCLAETGWQRSPIPPAAWGQERLSLSLPNGLSLYFQARDQAFAEALAPDLARLFDQLGQLSPWREAGGQTDLEIIISPADLAGPLLRAEAGRIVLNSPELAAAGAEFARPGQVGRLSALTGLDGEAAVRLALARALLPRTHPFRPDQIRALPGAPRFMAAAQTIMAARVLLPPQAQAGLLDAWRAQLGDRWVSPFFADMLSGDDDVTPAQIEAATHLLVDYIYHRHGPEALAYLVSRLSRVNSWNRVFGDLPMHSTFSTVAGRAFSPSTTFRGASEQRYSTLLLEIEAAYYAQLGQAALADLRREYSRPIPEPPFSANLRFLDLQLPGQQLHYSFPRLIFHLPVLLFRWPYPHDGLNGRRLYVDQPDHAQPVLVEPAPGLAIQTANGLSISPGCLGPDAELLLDGDWLEAPRRLRASRVTLQSMPLLTVPPPAPADTVAYLLVENDQPSLNAIYPFRPTGVLMALQPDGQLEPLIDMAPGLQIFPLPVAEGEPVHFLIRFDLPDCERSWFAHYLPDRGFAGQWFAPPDPIQWVWRAGQAEPLFLKQSPDQKAYYYTSGTGYTRVVEQPGVSDTPFQFLGWQAAGRLVSANLSAGQARLGLLDLEAAEMAWLANPPSQTLGAEGLSPDGAWLAYPAGVSPLYGPSNLVYLLDLNRDPTTVHTLRLDGGLALLAWSSYLDQPALALLSGSLRNDYTIRSRRLLLLKPGQPETLIEVAQAGRRQRLAAPIFCRSGELLYRLTDQDQHHLIRQAPGQPAQTLLTLNRPFQPLACP